MMVSYGAKKAGALFASGNSSTIAPPRRGLSGNCLVHQAAAWFIYSQVVDEKIVYSWSSIFDIFFYFLHPINRQTILD